jgi:hypothetical protein
MRSRQMSNNKLELSQMNALEKSEAAWNRLRPSCRWALGLFPLLFMLISLAALLPVTNWLSAVLDIAEGVPVIDQANGGIWLAAFFALMSVVILGSLFIGLFIQALFCWLILRWSFDKVIAVYIRSEFPREWEA